MPQPSMEDIMNITERIANTGAVSKMYLGAADGMLIGNRERTVGLHVLKAHSLAQINEISTDGWDTAGLAAMAVVKQEIAKA